MLNRLTKTQPDWHLPLNANCDLLEDKLTLMADCTYNETENAFSLEFVNVPDSFVSELPGNLPPLFSVLTKVPDDYVEDAVFMVGGEAYETKYAGFETGDVLIICFDYEEKRCFFRVSGGSAATSAYAGAAYAGASYVG